MKAWLLIGLLAACGNHEGKAPPKQKTPEALKQEWGAKVQAKLDKVIAAAKAASGGNLGAPGDAKLVLDFDWDDEKAHPNAIAVQVEDVQSTTEVRAAPAPLPTVDADGMPIIRPPSRPHPRFTFQEDGQNHVYKAKALLGVPGASIVVPASVYDQFVNAKYLLVVTPGEVHWPDVSGATFETGSVALRAMLVDIDTAKPLGGFETTAQSSEKVVVNTKRSGQTAADKLDQDLMSQASKAIAKGIEARWPGSKPPVLGWQHGW